MSEHTRANALNDEIQRLRSEAEAMRREISNLRIGVAEAGWRAKFAENELDAERSKPALREQTIADIFDFCSSRGWLTILGLLQDAHNQGEF